MVRLKVEAGAEVNVQSDVSIPYGSIKSFGALSRLFARIKFQFLMVRLKADSRVQENDPVNGFQFLMVRLKVPFEEQQQEIPQFQFLMVRLKARM